MWIRLDCIDWLVSYAADEHHYQGVDRSDPHAAVAVRDCDLDFDYQEKTWECKINVGVYKGKTLRLGDRQLTKEMYEKAAASDPDAVDMYWSKASVQIKRKACRAYLKLWSEAAIQGSLQEFEDDCNYGEPHIKRQRSLRDSETAEESQAVSHEESQAAPHEESHADAI